jgi:hypothetical protein
LRGELALLLFAQAADIGDDLEHLILAQIALGKSLEGKI